MSLLLTLLAAVVQVPATDGTGLIFAEPQRSGYQKWKLGLTDGYKEKKLAPSRWKVGAQSGRKVMKDLALLSTLYRAAVITKSAGYSRFFTAKMDIQNQVAANIVVSNHVYGQEVYSTIILHDDVASPPHCEANPKWAENCRDQSADEVIATVGPLLGQDSAALEKEIRETRARYYGAP